MVRRAVLAFTSMVLLAGCPRQALFVVLPDAEGSGVGAITIEEGATATTLDQPMRLQSRAPAALRQPRKPREISPRSSGVRSRRSRSCRITFASTSS
jgi:hypothetical protein